MTSVTTINPEELRRELSDLPDIVVTKNVKVDKGNAVDFKNLPDVDVCGLHVSPRMIQLIREGIFSDKDNQYLGDRSNAVFAVITALVQAGYSDENIASVLLNPDNGISESILEKGDPQGFVAADIKRCREKNKSEADKVIDELNKSFALVNLGNKTRVLHKSYDHALGRVIHSFYPDKDFRLYHNEEINVGYDSKGKPITARKGDYWLKSPLKRKYASVKFLPGKEKEGVYNLWSGFACDDIEGDWSLFKDHILNNICSGNQEHFEYIMNWMARSVQYLDQCGEVAIVLIGGKGTGKSLFAHQFGSIFGHHYFASSNPSQLVGRFNGHLEDCLLVFADELSWNDRQLNKGVLQTLITEPSITIERKSIDAYTAKNHIHMIIASNDSRVIPAGGKERRYMVLQVGEAKQQDNEYFSKLVYQMEHGGREAMLFELLHRDIQDFEVRDIPQTDALEEQKLLSMDPIWQWWFECLKSGSIFHSGFYDALGWESEISKESIRRECLYFTKQDDDSSFHTRFGLQFKKMLPSSLREGRTSDKARSYIIPSLDQCRKHFTDLTGIIFD